MAPPIPSTFCALAWVHSFVNIGGEYQVCCISEDFDTGIKDADGNVFNIKNKPSLSEVMNSDYMKELRRKMLSGEWSSACERCHRTEKLGGTSRRMIENKNLSTEIPDLQSATSPDGSISVKITSADYRLANICNLQCRMCNPRSSVMWLKDWNTVKNPNWKETMLPSEEAEYRSYDWIDSPYLLEEFRTKVRSLNVLHFAGGEPLIVKQMSRILEVCIDENVAHKIDLTYNTNLSKLPPSVLELWKQFRSVKLLVSIDGYGAVNDYIRQPLRWEVLEKSLRLVDEHADEYKISEIIVSTTVQFYNVLNLADLYDHLATYQKIEPAINLINLYTPPYLSTQALPLMIKQVAAQRLLEVKEKYLPLVSPENRYHLENIDQIISFMMDAERERYIPEFLRYTQKLDEIKGQFLVDHIPQLYKLLALHLNDT